MIHALPSPVLTPSTPKTQHVAYTITAASLADVHALYPLLRASDALELALTHGTCEVRHIEQALNLSTSAYAVHCTYPNTPLRTPPDAPPVMLFGVACVSPFAVTGVPWLLATDAFERLRQPFARQCRGRLFEMFELFERLENHAYAANTCTIAWLRWLGFQVEPAAPFGVSGALFHRFWKTRP